MRSDTAARCLVACGIAVALAPLTFCPARDADGSPTRPLRPQIEYPTPSQDGPTDVPDPRAFRPRFSIEAAGPLGLIGTAPAPSNQAETSIAASGSLVKAGFNDFTGATNSFSGYMYSSDGGDNFTYGGTLPAPPAPAAVGGDPSLTVWVPPVGPPVFYYSSLFTTSFGQNSLCIHRSVDGGATWAGPYEISVAPSGADFPDREWISVDPETGRLFVSWTHFGATVTIRVAYSDNAATGSPPTWTGPTLVGTRAYDGQSTFIQPDPAGPNVYLVWENYRSTGSGDAGVSLARSLNNGMTWTIPTDPVSFWHHIAPYGFDRWLWSVSGMALNPADGGIEVVYAASQNGTTAGDLGDIYHVRSANQGVSWSTPKVINVFPGTDRPQCFPTVAADASGAIHVYWYDLSAGSGRDDWTDFYHAFSTNFGATWSSPVPTTPGPFHNEAGNNFGHPHQGDYNDATLRSAANGAHAVFGWMNEPSPVGFGADAMVATTAPTQFTPLRLRPGSVVVTDVGCGADDGRLVAREYGLLRIPLENIGRTALSGVYGILTALSANVTIINGTRDYGTIASGATGVNGNAFIIRLEPSYACGEPGRLRLNFSTSTGGNTPSFLEFSVPTGLVEATTPLLSENFDGVTPPALPVGWSAINQCGTCTAAPWVTSATGSTSPPNAAFAPEDASMTFSRLQGPIVPVPAAADYVEVRFDLQHRLSQYDDRYAPSGASFEYQLDGAGGSRFATSDAEEFDYRYGHNIARQSGDQAGDRSAWSGLSPGFVPARIRVRGLGGHTLRPRFDLTTSGGGPVEGVRVDNVRIDAFELGCGPCTPTTGVIAGTQSGPALELAGPNPFARETRLRYSLKEASRVRLEVFSIAGQRVRSLIDRLDPPGTHEAALRLEDRQGRLKPGVYLVRLIAGGERRVVRVVATE